MSERDGFEAGVPFWVDTWRQDPEPTARFYAELFGWEVAAGPEYTLLKLRGRDVAGLGARDDVPPAWVTYVWVDSADEAASRVTDAGGQVVDGPFDSLDGGRMAIVADPAGAVFGVWQPGEHRGAQLVNEPSAWAMSALETPDPESANAFYSAVFGWEPEAFGPATMCRLPGFHGGEPSQPVPRDVVAVMMPGEQAGWNVNFWTDDIDAAAASVERLGGSVLSPPVAQPPGRYAVFADPDGAVFSLSQVIP